MPPRDRGGHAQDRAGVHLKFAEVDERQADLGGQRSNQLPFGDHTEIDEDPTEASTEPPLLLQRGGQLIGIDESIVEQNVAELLHVSSLTRTVRLRSASTSASARNARPAGELLSRVCELPSRKPKITPVGLALLSSDGSGRADCGGGMVR